MGHRLGSGAAGETFVEVLGGAPFLDLERHIMLSVDVVVRLLEAGSERIFKHTKQIVFIVVSVYTGAATPEYNASITERVVWRCFLPCFA